MRVCGELGPQPPALAAVADRARDVFVVVPHDESKKWDFLAWPSCQFRGKDRKSDAFTATVKF
jgi:hypothetical protein